MDSSERTALEIYRKLSEPDRRVVDAWRDLGNDWATSVLNARVLGAGPRRRPNDDPSDWIARQMGTDPALIRRNTAEHEAAHTVVARALGVRVVEVTVSEDGLSGVTRYESTSPTATAIIAAAAEVWIREFRALVFPGADQGFSGDRSQVMRNTLSDWEVRDAQRRARLILADSRDELFALAQRLIDTGRVDNP